MFSERSLRGPVWWEAGERGKQISSRPISSLIWPYRGNNEPLHCCLSPTPDLSPPPTNLHSQTVCFAFTYTYDLKESFRSWISPRHPPASRFLLVLSASVVPHHELPLDSNKKKKSFILELEVAQSFICNAVLVVQPLWSKQPLGSHVVYIIIIDFRRRDYTSALDMVMFSSTSARQLMSGKATPPSLLPHADVSSESQQEIIRLYESVLRFSQTSPLPVNGSCSALYHRHPRSRADTSARGKAPRETSVTRRWMEMYQHWINTPNNFPPSLPHRNRCYSSVVFSLPWCNVVPLLFIYPLIPVLVLSGCGYWMLRAVELARMYV